MRLPPRGPAPSGVRGVSVGSRGHLARLGQERGWRRELRVGLQPRLLGVFPVTRDYQDHLVRRLPHRGNCVADADGVCLGFADENDDIVLTTGG